MELTKLGADPEVQEAAIGVVFVLGSSAAILLLASNPQGGEHLKELLSGQILWVGWNRILADAAIYAALFVLWWGFLSVLLPLVSFPRSYLPFSL